MLCNHRVESGLGVDVGQSAIAQRVKHCHFELSIESEKSKEFKIRFEFWDFWGLYHFERSDPTACKA